ncbi:MAG: anti-sigma factor antagonist [Oscillatoriales cyanobacterium]|nr:MAG: anti-sigma factor antagonist [Oscillatoriales cyanobacterium]
MTLMTYYPCVLELQGHLDARHSQALRHQFANWAEAALSANQAQRLWLLDLAQVTSIDSAGISALVAGFKLARDCGCTLHICAPSAPVQMVFEIAQLDRVFNLFDSQASAIAAWEAAQVAEVILLAA